MIDTISVLKRTRKGDLITKKMRSRRDSTRDVKNTKNRPTMKDNLIVFLVDFKDLLRNRDMLS